MLRQSVQNIDRAIRTEQLPAFRPVGRRVLIRCVDLLQWVEKNPVWGAKLRFELREANARVMRLKLHVNTLNSLALGKNPDNAASWLSDRDGAPLTG
jgi:hypothetical protein